MLLHLCLSVDCYSAENDEKKKTTPSTTNDATMSYMSQRRTKPIFTTYGCVSIVTLCVSCR